MELAWNSWLAAAASEVIFSDKNQIQQKCRKINCLNCDMWVYHYKRSLQINYKKQKD